VAKVAMVGAGSAVFARQLMPDILAVEGLDQGSFALVDIDATRLDLEEVLLRADYVISSIEVAGLEHVRADYEIPTRYGVDRCIGDTIGPGGIFKALRGTGCEGGVAVGVGSGRAGDGL